MSISFAFANVLLLKASVTFGKQSLAGTPGGPGYCCCFNRGGKMEPPTRLQPLKTVEWPSVL